jgi:DUF4097 and DUF4098 domain-containing protein YvlB
MIAAVLALLSVFGGGVTAEQHFTFAPPHAPLVRVETSNGSIRVRAGGGRVEVTARKEAGSQAKVDALKVTATQSGNTVTIRAVFPSPCNDCGSVSFDVTVPSHAAVDLSTSNGSVDAGGLSGDARLSSSNGSLTAAYSNASAARTIDMETTNGSISLVLPAGTKLGVVTADTMVGHVSNDWNLTTGGGFVGGSIKQTVHPGGVGIHLSTTNGSISIAKV